VGAPIWQPRVEVQQTKRQDVDGAEAAYRAAIAADPGFAQAHNNLGLLLEHKRQDVDGAEAAFRAAIAADPGYARAHFNLGVLLKNERQDVDGAEAAYRAAIAADPRCAAAHDNLGTILEEHRHDLEGAEAAYRTALAADPSKINAIPAFNLADLLEKRTRQIEESGGDLMAAAAMYDECAQLYAVSDGVDHELTTGAQAKARAARAARQG